MSTFTQVLLLWIVRLQLAGCTTLRHQLGRVLIGDEMGLGKTLFIITFFMLGLIIGLRYKILPSAFIFFFIYIGSLLGRGQGKVLAVLLFFILGLYFAKKINKFKFF